MNCPKCECENRAEAMFCKLCGNLLEVACPKCKSTVSPDSRFCDACGQILDMFGKEPPNPGLGGERKYVTAVFSDLSGYTSMSEKLDPEEVKDIMTRIFGEIAQVVAKYEGFIEKFIGDAVVAFFGVPKAHEDDPIRAIKVAREIHELVCAMSPEVEKRTENPISMHTGINTGLVVTGGMNREKGTHGLTGETINVASRLSSLAKAGEILVGHDTYRQAEGHFTFEDLDPTTLKGKTELVQIHKVISPKERPLTIHRLSGLKAELIGRKSELSQLREAVENLHRGRGSIFCICGDAGTGKSRLVGDFKSSLDLKGIQWLEGHAYAYARNIPYFPLIDLLKQVLRIDENDTPENVRKKIESGMEHLVNSERSLIPFLGSLYSLHYPDVEAVSPELWKPRLQDAIQSILSGLAKRAQTIFFFEDLHWADPSFVELLRGVLKEIRDPAIVISAYRPTFKLFTGQEIKRIGKTYQEIWLQDLSRSEAEEMLHSLLGTENIPSDLKRFVQNKAQGNPFYLEEMINSLIDSGVLIQDDGSWKIERKLFEFDISPTIHGVISGRLDHLNPDTKRLLQEASVIGKTFPYEILNKITSLRQDMDSHINMLEKLDLIRESSTEARAEYSFKHSLIQEVVYSSLLLKERNAIHKSVGLEMEKLYHDRLPEYYEAISFHFEKGHVLSKALKYNLQSARKSFERYSLEESSQYYKKTFESLSSKPNRTYDDDKLLVDVLIEWQWVLHFRGEYDTNITLFKQYESLVDNISDKAKRGMLYAHFGHSLNCMEQLREAHDYLVKASELAVEAENDRVLSYAHARLARTCADLGLLTEAIDNGKKAIEIALVKEDDHELLLASSVGIAMGYFFSGDRKACYDLAKVILDKGQQYSSPRYYTLGYILEAYAEIIAGHFELSIQKLEKALQSSLDPVLSLSARTLLSLSYVTIGNAGKAKEVLNEVYRGGKRPSFLGTFLDGCLGIVMIADGELSAGIRKAEGVLNKFQNIGSLYRQGLMHLLLGKVYSRIARRVGPSSARVIFLNMSFFAVKGIVAQKKARQHLLSAKEISRQIGAKGISGQALFEIGLLHKARRQFPEARKCIFDAILEFEKCDAESYLEQAKKELDTL
jgi:class 3 adenylate cyclase/tetratricopeptide (TPR) repeat protein